MPLLQCSGLCVGLLLCVGSTLLLHPKQSAAAVLVDTREVSISVIRGSIGFPRELHQSDRGLVGGLAGCAPASWQA